jgi:hypothetical protein
MAAEFDTLLTDALLAELSRRGALTELHGAVGALHDHLERIGALDGTSGDSATTNYLVLRLRKHDAALSDRPGSDKGWGEKIQALPAR